MGLLDGKTALIFGVANDHSIAWGIARALHDEGAEVGFSSVESLIEKRVRPLAASIGSTFVVPCDVGSDEQIRTVFELWREDHESLDILVHALAFAKREDLDGAFVDTSREGFARGARRVGLLARRARTRGASPAPPRLVDHHPDLLRRREGRRELQRHGRRQGRARGVGPLPRGGPGTRRRPGQRDQRRARADPRGGRDRRLQGDVPRVRRGRAAAGQHHARRTSGGARSSSPRTSRAR